MIHLVLPLPVNRNTTDGMHWGSLSRLKNKYRAECWYQAIGQHKPLRDPPELVTVSAMFFTGKPWDADALTGALKFPLDALRQKQTGKMRWRSGLYSACGYFVDDDPKHMRLGTVAQEIDAKNRRLELTLEWVG